MARLFDFTQFKTLEDFVDSKIFEIWLNDHSLEAVHQCYDCPLIQKELKERMALYESLHYTKIIYFIEDLREICDCCWCPKTDGKIWWSGGCGKK